MSVSKFQTITEAYILHAFAELFGRFLEVVLDALDALNDLSFAPNHLFYIEIYWY